MKKMYAMLLAAVASLPAACADGAAATALSLGLKADGKTLSMLLESMHELRKAPDAEISGRAWTNIVSRFDPERVFFTPSDIAEFRKCEGKLGEAFVKDDFSFAKKVRETYRRRRAEHAAFATNFLASAEFDFKMGGELPRPGISSPWPSTDALLEASRIAHLKSEVLDEYISAGTNSVAAAAAAVAARYAEKLARKGGKNKKNKKKSEQDDSDDDLLRSAVLSAYDAHTQYLTAAEFSQVKSGMSKSLCGLRDEWK